MDYIFLCLWIVLLFCFYIYVKDILKIYCINNFQWFLSRSTYRSWVEFLPAPLAILRGIYWCLYMPTRSQILLVFQTSDNIYKNEEESPFRKGLGNSQLKFSVVQSSWYCINKKIFSLSLNSSMSANFSPFYNNKSTKIWKNKALRTVIRSALYLFM